MLELNRKIDTEKNHNVYILFGWEAIQARPNLDPYTSALRMNDETQQVYTSDVHIKHHVRRGMKSFVQSGEHPAFAAYKDVDSEGVVFYEKTDEFGQGRTFQDKLQNVRNAHGVQKPDRTDALSYCIDTPLFGYVHAVANEHFNVTNAANTLFRPITFHGCNILPLGRNNAFVQEGQSSSGSATVDSLEYGFFLALWEFNLNMLKVNASRHNIIEWNDEESYSHWVELLANGLWSAYTQSRYPSFTQRPQFAQFVVGWQPEPGSHSFDAPQSLVEKLENATVKDHDGALRELQRVLPDFLQRWNCTKDSAFVAENANNFTVELLS